LSDISGFTALAEALQTRQVVMKKEHLHPSATTTANGNDGPHLHAAPGASPKRSPQARMNTFKKGKRPSLSSLTVDATPSKSVLQRSGAEILVTICNQIFSLLIDTIHEYGGDVIKFAGDALLSVWRAAGDTQEDQIACCVVAAAAAAAMQDKMKAFTAEVTIYLSSLYFFAHSICLTW
jgi:class 3 adenylate cyclase